MLDTSAVVAYLAGEPGGEYLTTIRPTSALPFVALTELYYVLWRKQGQALAEQSIQHVLSWHLPVLTADTRICLSAGYLKSQYRLGLADSYVAALALSLSATLVTKDVDFSVLKAHLALHFLSNANR